MAENHNHIDSILEKYARGEILTDPETLLLEEWGSRSDKHRETLQLFGNPQLLRESLRSMPSVPLKEIWTEIERRINAEAPPETRLLSLSRHYRIKQYSIAALIIFGVAVTASAFLYMIFHFSASVNDRKPDVALRKEAVVKPTRKSPSSPAREVVLTRADNTQVMLDTVPVGTVIALDENRSARKISTDELVYQAESGAAAAVPGWNRLVIGGLRKSFNLRLPDGSRVLLDPGTELRYSLSPDVDQQVELVGDAWFNVARNSQRKVSVIVPGGMRADVLGTSFAMKAGPGEKEPKIALISGAVMVYFNTESRLLKPGGEIVLRDGQMVEQALGDEKGLFKWSGVAADIQFDNTEFSAVIRQIASWYRLKVYNPEKVKGIRVTGLFSRDQPPEVVLKEIENVESGAAWLYKDGGRIVISASPKVQ